MKNLIKLLRECDNEKAVEDLNTLILALAKTDPYVGTGSKLRPWCIHCEKKYDPAAGENDVPAQHEESCPWFCCWKLTELIKMAKGQGMIKESHGPI